MDLVSNYGMIISGAILLVAYIFIASEKIQKSVVALVGASLTMLLGLLPFHGSVNPQTETYIRSVFDYIEFEVIFLLIGMMIIVHIASRSGVFKWMAIGILKATKGHPKTVLFALAAFTAIASAFLDNVTTVVLVMPVTFVIAREFECDPVPFLITEVLASNIGGTATLIGDPPNIIIAAKAGLSFMDFVNELTVVVFTIFLVCVGILVFMFRKSLKATKENFYAFVDTLHIVLLFKCIETVENEEKVVYELYSATDNGPSNNYIIPLCSTLEKDGAIFFALSDFYECVQRHDKDIQLRESARKAIGDFLNRNNTEELPFN